ncbi:AraC family transcriptional regulator [Paraburkholderia sp. Tr-20389]|uniref:AraC family transcriptional regulator n=1 Tax=Paraburkholderia sp. Tr-20389 TaxID=2703903 RepID=UPI00197E2D54|nr:AraC family transcriptional regulator [Paraburkholderia sp. Tr-20389]MBN3754428.1 AraC family transcriptional regulator [Paraburkholderia sp. Tr-20389]
MHFDTHELTFDSGLSAGERWSDVLLNSHGLRCAFDAQQSVESTVKSWKLGDVGVSLADLAMQTLSPVGEAWPSWQGGWMFVKLVTAGHVHVQWRGLVQRFDAGSMFIVDPVYPFAEVFPERAQLTVLRVPKASLRERGVHHSSAGPLVGDARSPDVRATWELIQCIARQSTAPSAIAQTMMGDQLLELIEFSMIEPGARSKRRCPEALIHQAKRYIETHLGDTGLDVAAIAAGVHVSSQHLQRLFRTRGISLMRYVWQARLERAALLLRAGAMRASSIQEIGWQCGFATAAHFSRLFKRQYGVSPSDFRYAGVQIQQ